MPDYKKMYYTLFNAVTNTIAALQAAQAETEAVYMAEENENPLILLNPKKEEKQPPQK